MKLIIDINDNEYIGIKEYPNNITSYPVTIHLYDAIRKGIPLDKIRAEIDKQIEYNTYFNSDMAKGEIIAFEWVKRKIDEYTRGEGEC